MSFPDSPCFLNGSVESYLDDVRRLASALTCLTDDHGGRVASPCEGIGSAIYELTDLMLCYLHEPERMAALKALWERLATARSKNGFDPKNGFGFGARIAELREEICSIMVEALKNGATIPPHLLAGFEGLKAIPGGPVEPAEE